MKRRDFLKTTALGVGAAWVGTTPLASLAAEQSARFSAADTVVLGKTGIHTSRLACGTGTVGYQPPLQPNGFGDPRTRGPPLAGLRPWAAVF